MASDSMKVWCLRRGQHKERAILEQQLWALFVDPKGEVEWARKGITSRIASKVALPKCVSRDFF